MELDYRVANWAAKSGLTGSIEAFIVKVTINIFSICAMKWGRKCVVNE